MSDVNGIMAAPTYNDILVLARTIWGEARGEGEDGKTAVAHVILNRWKSGKWFGEGSIAETAQKPWQFSCWNTNDPNWPKIATMDLDDGGLQECAYFALGAIKGYLPDNTDGSTHYYAYNTIAKPNWATEDTFVCRIGGHEFHKGVD